MSQCQAKRLINFPEQPVLIVCHQPSPHPDLNHYDASAALWWAVTGVEPELWEEPPNQNGPAR